MDERRKAKRIELDAKLFVKRLDKDEAQELNIDVFDISTSGIGFDCNEALTIGAVYEADLTLWNKDVIHSFIEIVRISKITIPSFIPLSGSIPNNEYRRLASGTCTMQVITA